MQEAYETRKAKLDRTYEEMVREFSRSPEIYSTMRKKDIYNILSKGILLEDDKLVLKASSYKLCKLEILYSTNTCLLTIYVLLTT